MQELETRLLRPKFDRYVSKELRISALRQLNRYVQWVTSDGSYGLSKRYCRDPDDDKLVHLALAGHADFLISGDKDLLEMPPLRSLLILSPRDALRKISDENL